MRKRRLLELIDSWRLGVGVFVLFVLGLLIWNLYLTHSTQSLARRNRNLAVSLGALSRENAKRQHDAARAQVTACYERATALPALEHLLVAIGKVVAEDKRALRSVNDYAAQIAASTPTIRDCHGLADRLGIPRSSP